MAQPRLQLQRHISWRDTLASSVLLATALSLFTTIFAIGQIIGPVGAGVISDWSGGPEPGLVVAGLILLTGATVALAQRPLSPD